MGIAHRTKCPKHLEEMDANEKSKLFSSRVRQCTYVSFATLTKNRYLAFPPTGTEAGDKIVLLNSGSVPCVVRPQGRFTSSLAMLCTRYHGW
jgi:hypothetical protein